MDRTAGAGCERFGRIPEASRAQSSAEKPQGFAARLRWVPTPEGCPVYGPEGVRLRNRSSGDAQRRRESVYGVRALFCMPGLATRDTTKGLEAAFERPCSLRTGQIYPNKAEIFVGMLREEPLYAIAVVRIRQNANFMNEGELPSQI